MKSMNTKVKVFSATALGLLGMALTNSAMAVCPYPFNQPTGAWSAQVANQGTLAASNTGLEAAPNTSTCKMTAYLNAGASQLGTAAVADTHPDNEASYRFRFYINADTLSFGNATLTSTQVFAANAQNIYPPAGNNASTNAMLRLGLVGNGAGGKNLVAVAACETPPSYICFGSTPFPSGTHWIEGQLTKGATGVVKIWIDATVSTATPNISLTVDNHNWNGVKVAGLGLGGASPNFRTNFAGNTHAVSFDAFDSRRQTFIGQ